MDELDRVLIDEERVTPSLGFASRVMREVRLEAAEQARPLAFPWKGALLATVGTVVITLALGSLGSSGPEAAAEALGWLALCVAGLASWLTFDWVAE